MAEPVSSPASRDTRPLRRDAEANRRRIVEAAREMFAEHGLGVTLDDIASRAGVGVGTAYRRVTSKQALVTELFEERIEAMVAFADHALTADDPWDGFARLMTSALTDVAGDCGLHDAIFSEGQKYPDLARSRKRLLSAVASVMHRAQDAGMVRPDLAVTDLPLVQYMVGCAIRHTQPVSQEAWTRCLTIVLDGLRVHPDATPMATPALTSAEEERVMGLLSP